MPSYADGGRRGSSAREGEQQPLRKEHAPPESAGDSPGAVSVAQLQTMIDRSARVQAQAALAAELNGQGGVIPGRGVVQRYEGDPRETLRALLSDLLESGELSGLQNSQEVFNVVYRYYSRGAGPARTDYIPGNDDPVGVLLGQDYGIPPSLVTQSGGFVKVENPEYDAELALEGLTQQRLSVHVNPSRILEAMRACYDISTSEPQVSSFKMPVGQDAIRNRMDNLVIYFLDDAKGTLKEQLVGNMSLLADQGYLVPDHPPMLAPTGIPGVGSAEGWFSVGDARSQAIADAYLSWNRKGGLDGFLAESLKVLKKRGYNPDDLSKAPGEPKQGCFLSTACTQALGLPDDCLELQALRWLRDGYVRRLPSGRRELEAYYDLAPSVVRALAPRPDRVEVYTRIYHGLVAPVVTRVLAGDLAGGFRLYKRRALDLAGRSEG